MWSYNNPKQGIMLYFTASGLNSWFITGNLQGFPIDWITFIKYLSRNKAHFTRLDIAIDLLDYNFETADIFKEINKGNIKILDSVSRQLKADHQKFYGENKVLTGFTIGSRRSNSFLRVYNKKVEQSHSSAPYADLAHTCKTWTRFEGEFKHAKAQAIIPYLMKSKLDTETFNNKLMGYIVNQWTLVDTESNVLTPLSSELVSKAKGNQKIPSLDPKLSNRLVSLLKWLLVGGAGGVLYRIKHLYGEFGIEEVLTFLFKYISSPNTEKHYSVPNNLSKDLKLIKNQNPKSMSLS